MSKHRKTSEAPAKTAGELKDSYLLANSRTSAERYHRRQNDGIVEWPDNALRHSFASYHLAHFKNAASTALELGHHLTFSHYRELVKPKEAERYWNLKPAATEKVLSLMMQ